MKVNGRWMAPAAVLLMLAGGVATAASDWVAELREVPVSSDATYEGKSVSDFKNMVVVNREGQQLGVVRQVLADRKGEVKALAVDVDDSISGAREVILRLENASVADGNRVVVSYDRAALKGLPKWRKRGP